MFLGRGQAKYLPPYKHKSNVLRHIWNLTYEIFFIACVYSKVAKFF